jgi:hypothetical protein
VTYWETATALADRVEAAGANAAAVPVNQAGGALYASQLWTTPRYDLSVWSDGAADTPRRELLRLLALELGRRDLKLLPVLRFDAPTPLIDVRGEAYDADGEAATVARRLAIEETLDAIGAPGVIAGVAVRLMPGDWALRSALAFKSTAAAAGEPAESAERLAAAYDELARAIGESAGKDVPLVLLPSELATAPDLARSLAPKLGGPADGAATYAAQSGLAALVEKTTSVRVSAPYGAVAAEAQQRGDLATDAVLTGLRRSLPPGLGRDARSLRTANFPLRLIDSEKRLRGTGGATTGEILLPALALAPTAEPALLASAIDEKVRLVTLDSDASAGWLDEAAILRRRMYAATPALASQGEIATDDPETAPDVKAVAYDVGDTGSIAVVTKQSAWPRRLRVTIQTPQRLRGAAVDPSRPEAPLSLSSQWFDAGDHVLDLQLEPYQTIAWRFAAPAVRVAGVRVDPNPEALRELAEALADLQSRDTTQRRSFDRLLNPSFETPSGGVEGGSPIIGWSLGEGASVDAEVAADGATSVRLRSTAKQPATFCSEPFAAPSTGQLALGLRLLPHQLQPGCQLRIDLEQVNGAYRNHASATSEQLKPTAGETADAGKWLPIVFPMDDLPLRAPGTMRLRFTLVGEGELNVDDLRPEDLVLPLDGHGGIDMRTERFAIVRLLQTSQTLLDEARLEACRERLDSYWARFLTENYPRREAAVVQDAAPTPKSADEPDVEETTPSLSERLRGYMPRWWR